MKQAFLILCVVVLIVGAVPGWAQLKVVENTAPLTEKQKAVLAIAEKIPDIMVRGDKNALAAMMENSAAGQKVLDIKGLYYCVLFDTACTRSFLFNEGKKRSAAKDTRAAEILSQLDEKFISVREFVEKHKSQMQVTFQNSIDPVIQVELHGPRRPDAAHVPPPFGQYESVSISFVPADKGWKITLLFPEPFQILQTVVR